MSLVAELMRLPVAAPPYLVTIAVIFLTATATLIIGLMRRGRDFARRLPPIVFLWGGSVAFWTFGSARTHTLNRTAVAIAAIALVIEMILAARKGTQPRREDPGSEHLARRYLWASLLIAAGLLFYHLGTYSGPLLNWEAPVVAGYPNSGGFMLAYDAGQSVSTYAAQRLLWDEGLLSAGHTSLFYGAPTYALFHLIGFSTWSLRVAAVIATLLSIGVIYLLARDFFGPIVGAAAAMAFGLSSCVLFYGRYGSSPAGTLLAVLLAVWCTWRFLDSERPAWWSGPACAAALYVATLQYSTARIVVLILLGCLTVTVIRRWRRLPWQQAAGFAVIVVTAAAVWRLQSTFGTEETFLMARGEQYFDLIQNPQYIRELFDTDLLGRPVTAETITLADKIELAYRIVATTWPQYVDLMCPRIETAPLTDVTRLGALPQLYYAPLVLFIVWGFTHSLLRLRAWPHACLLVWVVAGTVPLLLTNRVDSHRMMLFVIPLSLWGALGMWEAAQVLAYAQVPVDLRHFFAALLALTVAYNDVHLLHRPARRNITVEAVATEAENIPGRVAIGVLTDHRAMGWLQLAMLERTRRDRTRAGKMLDDGTVREALAGGGARTLRRVVEDATVILAPAARFRPLAIKLQAQGVRVTEHGENKSALLRLEAGTAAAGIGDDMLQPTPAMAIRPSPTPISLATGPQIPLTTLPATDVTYSFAPPQIDRTWAGTAILMGGVAYAHGIGMHSWCRMTYTVPPGATAFQAIIGLSDEVHECSAADVVFEVRGERDQVLFRSGIVDSTTPPRPISVALRGAIEVMLVVTEGKNGGDCDHANWAMPAFLMPSQ